MKNAPPISMERGLTLALLLASSFTTEKGLTTKKEGRGHREEAAPRALTLTRTLYTERGAEDNGFSSATRTAFLKLAGLRPRM